MRYELSDHEWSVLRMMLPTKSRGKPRVDDRRVLNGIFWVLRSGAPWRDLPAVYGPRTTCYNRFVRWRKAGIWDSIMQALAAAPDAAVQMIDTSMIRVHQQAACIADSGSQAVGRSRGGLTSKLHVVVDGRGLPLRLGITAGQTHDNRLCSALLSALAPRTMLLADRGYDAGWIRALVNELGAWANIPPKCNRRDPICFSPHLYRARNLIERFFNKIKHCRRIATRYDKTRGELPGVRPAGINPPLAPRFMSARPSISPWFKQKLARIAEQWRSCHPMPFDLFGFLLVNARKCIACVWLGPISCANIEGCCRDCMCATREAADAGVARDVRIACISHRRRAPPMAMTRVEPVELTRAKVSEEALDLMLRLSSRAAPAKAKPGKLAVARSMLAKMLREAMADVSGVVASGAAVGGSAFIVYTFLKPWL